MAPRNWSFGKKKKSGYRSGLEETVAQTLKEKGVIFQYEPIKLTFHRTVTKGLCPKCGSTKVVRRATYTPDFVLDNGRIIEVKGRLTSTERTKLLAVRASNPERSLVLYFGSDNKLKKNGTKRYSDWCADHGFDFSVGTIPRRWLGKLRSENQSGGQSDS